MVFGATSQIGSELAVVFSKENNLFLVGRNLLKLQALEKRCLENGADFVTFIHQDLRLGIKSIVKSIANQPIHLFINAASSTSRLYDNNAEFEDLPLYLSVDLQMPLHFIQECLSNTIVKELNIVFVSTVLTLVKSPKRTVYTSLKILQEAFLKKIQKKNSSVNIMIIRVGKVIPFDRETDEAKKLAKKVFFSYNKKKKLVYYGKSGLAFVFLFHLQPIAFYAFTFFQRYIRKYIRKLLLNLRT